MGRFSPLNGWPKCPNGPSVDIVNRSLQELFWRRDIPFVSLSPFPDGEDLLFSFRVDTDFASQKEVETLYELCKKK